MDKKLIMIDFYILRTNQAIQEKMTNRYINRDGCVIVWTIGGQQDIDKMQKNLLG